MPITFQCPSCQKKLTVNDDMAGKVGQCPCGAQLKIPQATVASAGIAVVNPAQSNQAAVGSAPDSAIAGIPAGNIPQSAQAQKTPRAQIAASGVLANPNTPGMSQNMNSEFRIQCLQCGQEYPIRPDLIGQKVACKCGAPIAFEDPLGAGFSTHNRKLPGMEAADLEDAKPLAYRSQTEKQSESKKKARSREEEVLKMYIKDDGQDDSGQVTAKKTKTGSARSNAKRASFGIRLAALLVDGLIFTAGILACGFSLTLMAAQLFEIGTANSLGIVESFLVLVLPFMLVAFFFTLAWFIIDVAMAKTPGKMILGLEVLDLRGRKPDSNELLLRALCKYGGAILNTVAFAFIFAELFVVTQIINGVAGLLGLIFFIGCFGALADSKLALHDRLSKTQVVYVRGN